jgi:hypothetical protein
MKAEMKKLYEVTFKAYVIAEDVDEAEVIAKDIKLTIQDNSVKPTSIEEKLNSKIVEISEKVVNELLKTVNSVMTEKILKSIINDLGYTLSKEEFDTLYSHCEFIYLHQDE